MTEPEFRDLAGQRLEGAPSACVFDPSCDRTVPIADIERDAALARALFSDRPLRDAAVLVPIVLRERLTVLFTQRTTHLPSHAGQIAFPGGKLEAEDTDAVAAALREAREEIGLDARFIEPVGFLDGVRTRTGFNITPVVALVRPGFSLDIDYREVEEAFEVPLAFLLDPANHVRHEVRRNDEPRLTYAMPFARRFIWGVTAGIVRNLHVRLHTSGSRA
ncbi:MAG: hypothetical protein RLZ98_380 [Pseudomonadota bacterium]